MTAPPEPHGKFKISNGGGRYPEWDPSGRELLYLTYDNKLMAVSLMLGADTVEPAAPRELFTLPPSGLQSTPFAVAPDGKRFLVQALRETGSQPLEVILNWPALLKSKVGSQ